LVFKLQVAASGHLRRFDQAAVTSDLAWVADIVSGSQSIRTLPNHVDYVSSRRTNSQRQLFARNRDKALLVRAIPVWKGAASLALQGPR
jgi:hypothetical protein